ncbi:MAG: hypothetical protein AAF772_02515 [Acidobacteriota bacterium]
MDYEQLRIIIRRYLAQWRHGTLDEIAVQEKAEEIWDALDEEDVDVDKSHPHAAVLEVLHDLSVLGWRTIVREDIPAILRFLDASPADLSQAWRDYHAYWDGIDYEKRKQTLQGSSFYIL